MRVRADLASTSITRTAPMRRTDCTCASMVEVYQTKYEHFKPPSFFGQVLDYFNGFTYDCRVGGGLRSDAEWRPPGARSRKGGRSMATDQAIHAGVPSGGASA